jgi:hypothetical protein
MVKQQRQVIETTGGGRKSRPAIRYDRLLRWLKRWWDDRSTWMKKK